MQGRQFGQRIDPCLYLLRNQRRLYVLVSSMHHPMSDRFDLVERAGQAIEQNTQRMCMVLNLQRRRRTAYSLSHHLNGCDAPDALYGTLEQCRLSCEYASRLLNHVNDPKFNRRAPAIDHQNEHVTAEASRHVPGRSQSSCQSERCTTASGADFLPSKALVYVPMAAAPLHFAR